MKWLENLSRAQNNHHMLYQYKKKFGKNGLPIFLKSWKYTSCNYTLDSIDDKINVTISYSPTLWQGQ